MFSCRDPEEMSRLSGVTFDSSAREFKLRYLNLECTVSYPSGSIEVAGGKLAITEEALILLYLSKAKGTPRSGYWLSFMDLPGGSHHYAPFQKEALEPLARAYGCCPDKLVEAGLRLGGEQAFWGDGSFILPVFPYVYIGVVLWRGDDEFPPRANMIFEGNCPAYLDTASLYMVGLHVSLRLISYA